MLLKQIFMAVTALSFGLIASGGVFTVFVSVGLVPRFAGRTHTGDKILLYESCICAGTIAGCIISVFEKWMQAGRFILDSGIVDASLWQMAGRAVLIVFGVFAGMFVGCFAIAIAEMLNTIPIFTRRTGFGEGVGIAILCIALGKAAGSLLYFMLNIYKFGGQ